MANTYDINLTDGTLDFQIDEQQIVVDHGLTFTGRGVEDYGEHRNTNLLHLAENFASDTAPVNPLEGQTWFNTATNQVLVYDGVSFVNVAVDSFITPGTYQVGATTVTNNPGGAPAGPAAGVVHLPKDPGGGEVLDVVIDSIAEWTDFNAHVTAVANAHDADDITFTPAGNISSTNVQAAILELQDVELENHINDALAAHAATAISNTPFDDITSTNVQGAIQQIENDIDLTQALNNAVQTDVNNHIADTVDAHDADEIPYDNSTSGLTATDVQAAIDELALAGATGGGAGYVDCVRVTINSNQLIDGGAGGGANGVEEILEFDTFVDGPDSFGNFDNSASNWKYVADRPMQVRVRGYARFLALNGNQVGKINIRKNGALVRQALQIKLASDDVGTNSQTVEASWLDDLAINDEITIHAQLQSFGGSSDKSVQSGRVNTGFEVEVLRDLSP